VRWRLTDILQNMLKALGSMGYKTQSQPLNHFQDDYGLKAVGDEEPEEEDEEDFSDEGLSEGDDGEETDAEMEC